MPSVSAGSKRGLAASEASDVQDDTAASTTEGAPEDLAEEQKAKKLRLQDTEGEGKKPGGGGKLNEDHEEGEEEDGNTAVHKEEQKLDKEEEERLERKRIWEEFEEKWGLTMQYLPNTRWFEKNVFHELLNRHSISLREAREMQEKRRSGKKGGEGGLPDFVNERLVTPRQRTYLMCFPTTKEYLNGFRSDCSSSEYESTDSSDRSSSGDDLDDEAKRAKRR
jgi:hypothetical protein